MSNVELATLFTEDELSDIATALGIRFDEEVTDADVVDTILSDINTNGVPETDDPIITSFLFEAGFIDENGELVGGQEDDVKLPQCFSLAELRDPSCRKCKVLQMCLQSRVSKRPSCFGVLWDATDPQCLACIEYGPCRQTLQGD